MEKLKELMEYYLAQASLKTAKIKVLVQKEDLNQLSTLAYFERYDMYQLMESSLVNQVM